MTDAYQGSATNITIHKGQKNRCEFQRKPGCSYQDRVSGYWVVTKGKTHYTMLQLKIFIELYSVIFLSVCNFENIKILFIYCNSAHIKKWVRCHLPLSSRTDRE